MKLTLHLGVMVLPYRSFTPAKRRGKRRVRAASAVTTADVADFLEARYGLVAAFYKSENKFIVAQIQKSLQGALEAMLMRQPVDPLAGGTQAIETRFRYFISTRRAERVGIPGTPTKAALQGINHRLARPYSMWNPQRPSFRDTGTYMMAFKVWGSLK